ncbi:two-component system, NarL family, nitrate/nitrite sensor histidine kinase NarX [Marinobacter persicus]|uniref:Sensor protein n=1 Tax=Marinobacter persicus TaxID=930118 RepID=A0A1I3VQY3_9GAMM|nr:histidine kinase [Marinobacter persicus]GHD50417.1 histidine kinase [Marinobacter persicus]SFJ97343.1 two-component system, NarL family, nitrate/nitrite sensor histidine kinase NarX [Marinobacter persicus]
MTSKHPLVNRVAVVIGAILLTALVGMASTLAVSTSIEGNATAINKAGALRLGAFELVSRSAARETRGNDEVQKLIQDYNQKLESNAITGSIPRTEDHPLARQYQQVRQTWQSLLKPAIEFHQAGTPVTREMMAAAEHYIGEVNSLVTMLEHRTEARIDLLHLIQISSMVFSVLIVSALFVDLRNRVIKPLRKLVYIAGAVGEKDFSHKAKLKGSDELARLGNAFDQMTDQLAQTYQQLESQAREKTRELEVSHSALQVMHSASRNLFANHDLCGGSIPMLQELERLLGIGPIRLYLHDKESEQPVEAVTTATDERPFYCRDHHCTACLVTPEQLDELPLPGNDGRRLLLPIRTPGQILGTLEVWYPAEQGLPATARRLLETLSDQLATAIYLEKQITEEQQQTLAEERTVIARELHDSLAQSLSYLKMQVARMRRLNIEGDQKAMHDDILDELSTGLNSAYRQLRELLATFRLKLDTPDLLTALRKTIDEFTERLGHPVALDYNLPPQTLSPNEEIHTLQIIREALANAVKHAEAKEISVAVLFETPAVKVRIQDDGKGLPGTGQPVNHYGMVIMQDRARTLGGQVQVQNRDEGGVAVTLSFVPKSRNLISTDTTTA